MRFRPLASVALVLGLSLSSCGKKEEAVDALERPPIANEEAPKPVLDDPDAPQASPTETHESSEGMDETLPDEEEPSLPDNDPTSPGGN